MKNQLYDHYVALDWAKSNMAIARMTKKSNKITVIDVPADIEELKVYLSNLSGRKILTIEETTTTQWLFVKLSNFVDKILVCDPYRNRLLSEGPKNDKIDASKLVQLLRANLLKEVYHCNDKFLHLRRLVSGYEDLVKAGVRSKNQRSALLQACGVTEKKLNKQNKQNEVKLSRPGEQFVLKRLDRQIESYEKEKQEYEVEFEKLAKKHSEINHQKSLPGIGIIGAVKIISRTVTPYRFASNGHWLSYVGLVKLEKISGNRSYGRKNSRYSRELKSVYKTGAITAIRGNNPLNDYYEYLIREKNYPEHNARHKTCRRLAILSLGIFKSKKRFKPYERRGVIDKKI